METFNWKSHVGAQCTRKATEYDKYMDGAKNFNKITLKKI